MFGRPARGDPRIGPRLRALLSASGLEIGEREMEIEHAARDRATVFYQARIHQVWGRVPA
jgi:hypothetical protein